MSPRAEFRGMIGCLGLLALCVGASAGVALYDFTIKSARSGLDASIEVSADTVGTLIGNYDPDGNPTGTRTKPGLFGPFGDTENLPVGVSLGASLAGTPRTQSAGGFQLTVDPGAGILNMSKFTADFLHSGPEALGAEISLLTETFRTRNPTFLYLGGIPITIPIGEVVLSSLSATQIGAFAPGTLTPLSGGRYAFVAAPLVGLTGTIDILGTELELPVTPVPLVLTGEIAFDGDAAHLTSVQPLDLGASVDPMVALPQIPLDLPTLNPSAPAHVLLDLALESIGVSLVGELRTEANGILVPEPATFVLTAVLGMLYFRRR